MSTGSPALEPVRVEDPAALRAVYVHSPYCARRCPYCDFAIEVLPRASIPPSGFVDALALELELRLGAARSAARRPAPRTLYVGGGTPTALRGAERTSFLTLLSQRFDRRRLVEYSVEANPEDFRDSALAGELREAGVTRVTLGVQSLDPRTLRALGRAHDGDDVRSAIDLLRRAGIRSVGVDLIFAVPGQTLTELRDDASRFLAIQPDHVSAYALTYGEDTRLTQDVRRGRIRPQREEAELEMFRELRRIFGAAGLQPYEVSNFAKPGHHSRHNLVYWRNEPHMALGPSAVGLLSGVRYRNTPRLEDWQRTLAVGRDPAVERERLDAKAAVRESVMVGLRLARGIHEGRLRRRHGLGFEALDGPELDRLEAQGLLRRTAHRLALTPRGLELADGIAARLL